MTTLAERTEGIIKARARAAGIELAAAGGPLFARDQARYDAIVREVRSAPAPRAPWEVAEDEAYAKRMAEE